MKTTFDITNGYCILNSGWLQESCAVPISWSEFQLRKCLLDICYNSFIHCPKAQEDSNYVRKCDETTVQQDPGSCHSSCELKHITLFSISSWIWEKKNGRFFFWKVLYIFAYVHTEEEKTYYGNSFQTRQGLLIIAELKLHYAEFSRFPLLDRLVALLLLSLLTVICVLSHYIVEAIPGYFSWIALMPYHHPISLANLVYPSARASRIDGYLDSVTVQKKCTSTAYDIWLHFILQKFIPSYHWSNLRHRMMEAWGKPSWFHWFNNLEEIVCTNANVRLLPKWQSTFAGWSLIYRRHLFSLLVMHWQYNQLRSLWSKKLSGCLLLSRAVPSLMGISSNPCYQTLLFSVLHSYFLHINSLTTFLIWTIVWIEHRYFPA